MLPARPASIAAYQYWFVAELVNRVDFFHQFRFGNIACVHNVPLVELGRTSYIQNQGAVIDQRYRVGRCYRGTACRDSNLVKDHQCSQRDQCTDQKHVGGGKFQKLLHTRSADDGVKAAVGKARHYSSAGTQETLAIQMTMT